MEPLQWVDILTMFGIFMANITVVMVAWNNTQVKIKQIDVQLQNLKERMETHIKVNDKKFEDIIKDDSLEHKAIMVKQDNLLEKLTDFQIYMEQRLK